MCSVSFFLVFFLRCQCTGKNVQNRSGVRNRQTESLDSAVEPAICMTYKNVLFKGASRLKDCSVQEGRLSPAGKLNQNKNS